MEEMVNKFIEEGIREHEEMGAFIKEFRITNELLLKERNNSLSELEFEVHGLSRAINKAQIIDCEFKGVTTRGGKTTTETICGTNVTNGPPTPHHDKPVTPIEVPTETEPQKTKEQTVEPQHQYLFPTGLSEPKPKRMSIELADRSIQYPRGIEENVIIKNDKFVLPIDFVILDMREDSRISIIIGRPVLATARAMIDVFNKKITLRVRNEEIDSVLLNNLEKCIDQSDLESCGKSADESEKPIRRIKQVDTAYPESQETQESERIRNEHLYSACANEIDEKKPELKDLPSHLEYAYLKGNESCPVIISSKLTEKEKISLLQVLEKRKGAIAWKMSNIKGISPSFCTHKILMEESFKPVIQPQRCLNLKFQDVVKNKIARLLDSGLIYPILDSPWVSPINVFPKKRGMSVVLNDNNELIPSRTVTGWRVMPFGLCNAPTTFQRCMTAIFHDMVEDFMEVFMDDFSVFGNSFDQCLGNLDEMLTRCEETNLVLNWEKCHFMVKEGIVLGHKISGKGIEVDKAKINVIAKLPTQQTLKVLEVSSDMLDFIVDS
ncbi:DNA-directed DNA polymerase [Tanacetum coccineum]